MTEKPKDIDPSSLAVREVLSAMETSDDRANHDKALIGNEVRFWRKERGLTGAKLAKLSEITPGMLTNAEPVQDICTKCSGIILDNPLRLSPFW